MTPAKLHHTVPRFYLAGFARGNNVTTVDLATSRSFGQSIFNASAENNFYTVDSDAGPDVFEKALSAVEADTAKVFQSIQAGTWPLSQLEREQLAYFLAVQAVRGRHHRHTMNANATDVVRHAIASGGVSGVRAMLGEKADGLTDEEVAKSFDLATTPGRFELRFAPEAHVEQIAELADDLEAFLSMRPWQLVRFDRPALLTSDRPVSLVRDAENIWMTGGFATAMGVTFPIDRETGLIMGEITRAGAEDASFDSLRTGTPAHRDLLNRQSVGNAHEQVHHHPDDANLFGDLLR